MTLMAETGMMPLIVDAAVVVALIAGCFYAFMFDWI